MKFYLYRLDKRLLHTLLFSFLFLTFCGVYQGSGGGTATSRFALLQALAVDQSLSIDSYHERTYDKAYWEGHFYSNKAPGLSLLALPSFYISILVFCNSTQAYNEQAFLELCGWVTTSLTLGTIGATGGVCLFIWLTGYVGPRIAMLLTLGVGLGTPYFSYCTILLSHSLVVVLFLLVMKTLDLPSRTRGTLDSRKSAFVGTSLALALSSEFSCGIPCLALAFLCYRSPGFAPRPFLLAFISICAIVPAYNLLCFDNLFTFGYHHPVHYHEISQGFFGISWPPDLNNLLFFLTGPERGLFFWSPFLTLALIGCVEMAKRHFGFACGSYALFMIQVLVICGYWEKEAGLCLGPRYLLPVLPFLILPCAYGIKRVPILGSFLVGLSILAVSTATLIDAKIPGTLDNPIFDFLVPKLWEGEVVMNFFRLAGVSASSSVACGLTWIVSGSLGLCYLAHLSNPVPLDSLKRWRRRSLSTVFTRKGITSG